MANCSNVSTLNDVIFDPGLVFATIVLGLINIMVLFGNSLVIFAVITTRKLRTVTNVYIVSLACADLLLGISVLPFSISREILHFWPFGTLWCNMWLAIDVLLCTASILNLCAISLDRYLAVTRPIQYPSTMSRKKGKIIVACVWILAFVVCLPPLIGWNDAMDVENEITYVRDNANMTNVDISNNTRTAYRPYEIVDAIEFKSKHQKCLSKPLECELTKTRGYRIYAALGSFYIPMFVMVFFYFKIYRAAVKTASSLRTGILTTRRRDDRNANGVKNLDTYTLRVHRGGTNLARSPSRGLPRRASSYACSDINYELDSDLESSRNRRRSFVCTNGHGTTNLYQIREERKKDNSKRKQKFLDENTNGENVNFLNTQPRSYSDSNSYLRVDATSESPFLPKRRLSSRNLTSHSNGNKKQRAVAFLSDTKASQKSHIRKFHRETKAAKTVAIIVGAFIVCWLPFFTIYLIGAFCSDCVPALPFSIIFWLGYCNSMINPCIYALFSRDFRFAFRRILRCRRFYRPETKNIIARRQFVIPALESESYSDY
ncbi:hypothetical protein KUTeg_004968 [Tegillarca granosa]|uniref:G-protein coupled receptors family 1 profile domain-containing protein n=1 Tax=Tegillarca granosa TaxID=220873 RepID=A0ABQ9FIF1_TEGGR|nr:hypothetical protein KUTeg_004968 [Tegillarca granosa]